ncbi:MAG TPA: amidase domain-containing protein [Chloroflexota bacterium]|nr:amidase domain-containing protein [Chloroflexota bacterium]
MRKVIAVVVFCAAGIPLSHPALASSGYSGTAAASYADTYWSNYNPAWPSFANSGGDCTNFVSQALYAGGIAMRTSPTYSGNAAWYMIKVHNRWSYSNPWVNAQDDSVFLEQHLTGIKVVATIYGAAPGQTVSDGDAQPGDVVLYDWNNDGTFDHEAIVTASDGTKNADGTTNYDLVDAHTNNRYHAYWTLAQYNTSWQTTRIVVLHIPAGTS